jgi:prephenate dehydrogenase
LAVLGTGLLGASVLRAAARSLPGIRLSAWSRSPSSRATVADIAETHETPEAAARGADCVILATPVDTLPGLLMQIRDDLEGGGWVTDVGSTKRGIHAAAEKLLSDPGRFVGGHPMAGSEKGGAAAARADLLDGRPCLVTRTEVTKAEVVDAACRLWNALGGRAVILDPGAHDAAVAEISHLPHATASLLAAVLGARAPRTDLAAGGLRDTTRVAGGDPSLWVPILLENADKVAPLVGILSSEADRLRRLLEARDADGLREHLETARRFRQSL